MQGEPQFFIVDEGLVLDAKVHQELSDLYFGQKHLVRHLDVVLHLLEDGLTLVADLGGEDELVDGGTQEDVREEVDALQVTLVRLPDLVLDILEVHFEFETQKTIQIVVSTDVLDIAIVEDVDGPLDLLFRQV